MLDDYLKEMVSVIENAGINVTAAIITGENEIYIDVAPGDEEAAHAAVTKHFRKKGAQRLGIEGESL